MQPPCNNLQRSLRQLSYLKHNCRRIIHYRPNKDKNYIVKSKIHCVQKIVINMVISFLPVQPIELTPKLDQEYQHNKYWQRNPTNSLVPHAASKERGCNLHLQLCFQNSLSQFGWNNQSTTPHWSSLMSPEFTFAVGKGNELGVSFCFLQSHLYKL